MTCTLNNSSRNKRTLIKEMVRIAQCRTQGGGGVLNRMGHMRILFFLISYAVS